MTSDETDPLAQLTRHGAAVLSDAADRLGTGPQSWHWYDEHAATCLALATAFTVLAQQAHRADHQPGP
jgi:hypothetical protein